MNGSIACIVAFEVKSFGALLNWLIGVIFSLGMNGTVSYSIWTATTNYVFTHYRVGDFMLPFSLILILVSVKLKTFQWWKGQHEILSLWSRPPVGLELSGCSICGQRGNDVDGISNHVHSLVHYQVSINAWQWSEKHGRNWWSLQGQYFILKHFYLLISWGWGAFSGPWFLAQKLYQKSLTRKKHCFKILPKFEFCPWY